MRTLLLFSIILFCSCNKDEKVKPEPFKLKGTWESVDYKPSTVTLHAVWEFKNDSQYVWTIYDSVSVVYQKSGIYKTLPYSKIRVYATLFAYTDVSYQIIDNRTILYTYSNSPWIAAYKK